MTFNKSISICINKYFDYNGRASRSEFWWFYLFVLLLWIFANFVFTSTLGAYNADFYGNLVALILGIPTATVANRRLHDIDKSGWWQLLGLTFIGLIPLIIWWAKKGTSEENQYGSPITLEVSV